MSLSADVIDRMWDKFDMRIRESRDRIAELWVNGKLIVLTKRSHGRGKLSGNIGTFIRQQMKLNENDFRDAMSCPLDREGYLKILREKKLIESK